jgi:GT2 family glycosyltransferase
MVCQPQLGVSHLVPPNWSPMGMAGAAGRVGAGMAPTAGGVPRPISVVIATRNRAANLLRTLQELSRLPERPPLIVVDNASDDDSVVQVRRHFPSVTVLARQRNEGAVARNVGVAAATTPYVAFCDDDSWWAPGALGRIVEHFERFPRLGVVQARILVGPDGHPDPACEVMGGSPFRDGRDGTGGDEARGDDWPGPALLGFIACGAAVRRSAFLEVGGFDDLLFFLGEEEQLALALASNGWQLAYLPAAVAHHHPGSAPGRDRRARDRLQRRNALLTSWMRRPWPVVARHTVRTALADPPAALDALVRTPKALARRRPVPSHVEAQLRRLAGPDGRAAG